MSDDWGTSFIFSIISNSSPRIFFWWVEESDSEPSVKGKPLPAKVAPAKAAPATPPVKKPAVVKSKWDGEDKEEDAPVVSLSSVESVILWPIEKWCYIRVTGRNLQKKSLQRRKFVHLLRRPGRKGLWRQNLPKKRPKKRWRRMATPMKTTPMNLTILMLSLILEKRLGWTRSVSWKLTSITLRTFLEELHWEVRKFWFPLLQVDTHEPWFHEQFTGTSSDLDSLISFQPRTKEDFQTLSDRIIEFVIQRHQNKPLYPSFIEHHARALAMPLKDVEVRKVASGLTTLANEKQKEQRDKASGKKKPKAASKPGLASSKPSSKYEPSISFSSAVNTCLIDFFPGMIHGYMMKH